MLGLMKYNIGACRSSIQAVAITTITWLMGSLVVREPWIFKLAILCAITVPPLAMIGSEGTIDADGPWKKFEAILPVTRHAIIASKYLICLLLIIAGIFFGAVVLLCSYLLIPEIPLSDFLGEMIMSIGIAFSISALLFVLTTISDDKIGGSVSLLFLLVFPCLVLIGIFVLLAKSKGVSVIQVFMSPELMTIGGWIFFIAGVLSFLFSYPISQKLYRVKEL